MKFEVQAINRHRIGIDGKGITTLVALKGCPLRCEYCINKRILSSSLCREYTPEELSNEIMRDAVYFLGTNGGVTFGGGESLLHSEAIIELRKILPDWVNINIETSLNVDNEYVPQVIHLVNEIIIDIKDMDTEIYKAYTQHDNKVVYKWLEYIVKNNLQHKSVIRIPYINRYNNTDNIKNSKRIIESLGFKDIDVFRYR